MKFTICARIGLALLFANRSSAHYIFYELFYGTETSMTAVRVPQDNMPFHEYASGTDIRCNVNPYPATDTVTVFPNDTIGFKLSNQVDGMYHQGPAAIYLGKVPDGNVSAWDGSGKAWFKIAEWGPVSDDPMLFSCHGQKLFNTTIPKHTPSGEYLVRIEQYALHNAGTPEIFVSCAQIRIENGGNGNPPTVSIPGYVPEDDPSVMVNIYPPYLHPNYTCPGPAVWQG